MGLGKKAFELHMTRAGLLASAQGSNQPNHLLDIVIFVYGSVFLVLVITAVASAQLRSKLLRVTVRTIATLIYLFFIAQAIAEFWVANYSNPASYATSWGGPSLIGVFVVHSGPGAAILLGGTIYLLKRYRQSHAGRQKQLDDQLVRHHQRVT